MANVFEDMNPTPIENARVQQSYRDGVLSAHYITPNSGYVLHDNARDWEDEDPETMETITKLGFTRGTASCGANYDFTINSREFYAVLETEVPADQIFSNPGAEHEIM